MDRNKRKSIQAAGIAAAGMALPGWARAQTAGEGAGFPRKPITLVVPAPPGGGNDSLGRALADIMAKELGQPVLVDNRPGAGGTMAAQLVARAPADGYTLFFAYSAPIYFAPYLFSKLAYDPGRDFDFISYICDGVPVLVAHNDVPARTMQEVVAWVQAQGKGKVSYGSYGIGSVSHLLSAYLSESRGLGMNHIPYKGEAPMVLDVLRGEVPIAISSVGTVLPHILSGKLKGVVNFTKTRMPELPNVPTIAEAGFPDPEFNPIGGVVMVAPAGVPQPVLQRLETVVRAAVQATPMRARFQVYGVVPIGSSAVDAKNLYESTKASRERLVKLSGARLD
jgi:tripartite-type tricarboxylate transporter receptor subunit TctC